jgi:hypothetical protein
MGFFDRLFKRTPGRAGPVPDSLDVEHLDALGFFRYVRPELAITARTRARETGDAFGVETRRIYGADAEEIAEMGALDLISKVAPFLKRAGVPIEVSYAVVVVPRTVSETGRARATLDADGWLHPDGPRPRAQRLLIAPRRGGPLEAVQESWDDQTCTHLLSIGDREIVLTDALTPADERWDRATDRLLSLLDELLQEHAASDRAYVRHGGSNDQELIFLTPKMVEHIGGQLRPSRAGASASPLDAGSAGRR